MKLLMILILVQLAIKGLLPIHLPVPGNILKVKDNGWCYGCTKWPPFHHHQNQNLPEGLLLDAEGANKLGGLMYADEPAGLLLDFPQGLSDGPQGLSGGLQVLLEVDEDEEVAVESQPATIQWPLHSEQHHPRNSHEDIQTIIPAQPRARSAV